LKRNGFHEGFRGPQAFTHEGHREPPR
jgi:hypothetical protein